MWEWGCFSANGIGEGTTNESNIQVLEQYLYFFRGIPCVTTAWLCSKSVKTILIYAQSRPVSR